MTPISSQLSTSLKITSKITWSKLPKMHASSSTYLQWLTIPLVFKLIYYIDAQIIPKIGPSMYYVNGWHPWILIQNSMPTLYILSKFSSAKSHNCFIMENQNSLSYSIFLSFILCSWGKLNRCWITEYFFNFPQMSAIP